jgi:hypothetical protein
MVAGTPEDGCEEEEEDETAPLALIRYGNPSPGISPKPPGSDFKRVQSEQIQATAPDSHHILIHGSPSPTDGSRSLTGPRAAN